MRELNGPFEFSPEMHGRGTAGGLALGGAAVSPRPHTRPLQASVTGSRYKLPLQVPVTTSRHKFPLQAPVTGYRNKLPRACGASVRARARARVRGAVVCGCATGALHPRAWAGVRAHEAVADGGTRNYLTRTYYLNSFYRFSGSASPTRRALTRQLPTAMTAGRLRLGGARRATRGTVIRPCSVTTPSTCPARARAPKHAQPYMHTLTSARARTHTHTHTSGRAPLASSRVRSHIYTGAYTRARADISVRAARG